MRQAVEDRKADKNPGDIAFFGLFLCTEMGARESLPIILEILRLPDEGRFDMFGDAIHEVVSQALVTLAGDDIDLLDRMIGDREINQYVRWSIGKSFVMLVRDGRLSHEEAVSRLRRHLTRILEEASAANAKSQGSSDPKQEQKRTVLVESLFSLLPHDGVDDMVKACELGLIDESIFGGAAEIRERTAEGLVGLQQEFQRLEPSRLEDTVAELSTWAGYQEAQKRRQSPRPGDSTTWTRRDNDDWEREPHSSQTITRDKPRVSRNDPCPCGSGKKFKKCCGRS